MGEYHGRLRRNLLIGCAVFIVVLCAVYGIIAGTLYTRSLLKRYNEDLKHIMNYVAQKADGDDLRACAASGQKSEKYEALQLFLNEYVDAAGLEYIYIIKFNKEKTLMVNLCSSTNARERAAGEGDMPLLETTDAYSQETLNKYIAAWSAFGATFFEEKSEFGDYYTGCLPLKARDGDVIGLICADFEIASVHKNAASFTAANVVLAFLICVVSAAVLVFWLGRNVTQPIEELEASARRFAERDRSSNRRDTRFLLFVPPKIRVKNEVKSLSDALMKMTDEMKNYVDEVVLAEEREKNAKEEAAGLQTIAYQDALTRVKSKAAYKERTEELAREIECGSARFAIVMVDLNYLKKINDSYGHANGDKYLIGTSKLVCEAYKHSPVYRVGGDEFVVVLTGEDYDMRDELLADLRARLRETAGDASKEPWERYSAACGMAEFEGTPDETVGTVFTRADETMYKNKVIMKKEMS